MLDYTKYHLTSSGDKLKFRHGVKFENVIRDLYPEYSTTLETSDADDHHLNAVSAQVGEGLHIPLDRKKIIKANVEEPVYQMVYYDDPNELCQRLYLLHASKQAGNESVNNEILSIESELRRRELIY